MNKLMKVFFLLCLAALQNAMAGHFTRQQLKLAMEYCAKEYADNLKTSFVRSSNVKGEFTSNIDVKSDHEKMWFDHISMYFNKPKEPVHASLIHEEKLSERAEIKYTSNNSLWASFELLPLPVLLFDMKTRAFDRLGNAKSVVDLVENVRIFRPEGPDIEPFINKNTEQKIGVYAHKQQLVECLEQLLESPKTITVPLDKFNKY